MDLLGIKDLPPGSNPFAARAFALDRLLYNYPTKGYTVRVGFYLVLVLWYERSAHFPRATAKTSSRGLFCCSVLVGIVVLDHRRKQVPERLWLFKTAQRSEGTWIITK